MLWKQLTALGIDGITIRIMIEIILIMSTVNKNNFLNILIAWYTMAFVKVTDKTDGKNPKKREDYWRRTWKSTHYLDLMFKAVSGERHIE